jgi:Cdc6-like AAA superfamily ATPase
MDDVSRAFSELLNIVSGIAIGYYTAVHGSRQSTRLDIYATFGASIDSYRARVQHCEHEIWNFELRSQGYDDTADVQVLQDWLAPQDKVLAFLSTNHISMASRPEEYTCIWFQPHLNQFFKNDEKVLLVEGISGSGKTTLANWVVSRLQRPIGGRVIPTLNFFYSKSDTSFHNS